MYFHSGDVGVQVGLTTAASSASWSPKASVIGSKKQGIDTQGAGDCLCVSACCVRV